MDTLVDILNKNEIDHYNSSNSACEFPNDQPDRKVSNRTHHTSKSSAVKFYAFATEHLPKEILRMDTLRRKKVDIYFFQIVKIVAIELYY